MWAKFQTTLKQAQRRIHIRDVKRRFNPVINEEDIDYSQISRATTSTNYKNIIYNAPRKTQTNHKQNNSRH